MVQNYLLRVTLKSNSTLKFPLISIISFFIIYLLLEKIFISIVIFRFFHYEQRRILYTRPSYLFLTRWDISYDIKTSLSNQSHMVRSFVLSLHECLTTQAAIFSKPNPVIFVSQRKIWPDDTF